jgi:hypothetical protein
MKGNTRESNNVEEGVGMYPIKKISKQKSKNIVASHRVKRNATGVCVIKNTEI